MRLNKYIVELGICSRRKADALISARKVKVNGEIAELGYQVQEGDSLELEGKLYPFKKTLSDKLYLALYKPKSYITSFEDDSRDLTLKDLLVAENFLGSKADFDIIKTLQLHYAGRLDKDSTGLIILSNDGDLNYKLTHPKFESEKEYLVDLENDIDERSIRKLADGVEIDPEDDGQYVITNPCFVEKISARRIRIILNQGFKRQIRLMIRAINNRVFDLKRLRVANIALKDYEIFAKSSNNKSYTSMVILDELKEAQFCIIEKPHLS